MGLVAAGVGLLVQLLFMLVCFYEDLAAAVPGFANGAAAGRTTDPDGGVAFHQFPVSKEVCPMYALQQSPSQFNSSITRNHLVVPRLTKILASFLLVCNRDTLFYRQPWIPRRRL